MALRLRFLLPVLTASSLVGSAAAQDAAAPATPLDASRALAQARAQQAEAGRRAETLEQAARQAVAEADRTAQESAALAARIQQAEATIAANQAQIAVIAGQRAALRARLAIHQQPLIRLTAALQRLSRRPPVLSLLRPGSLQDSVYLRAVLQTMLPQVQSRTAGLRTEIDRARALEARALAVNTALRASEGEFTRRRQELAAIETRQRLASREASGIADRESERALALAEQARDLGGLVEDLARQGEVRAELAALPGPILRPALPASAKVGDQPTPAAAVEEGVRGPVGYRLPVAGRLVQGFGESAPGKPRARGIALAANPSAQAVSPAAGRVAFAGPYAGYGQVVIIEHPGGWTSVVTGLVQLDTRVGQQLVTGSPLGLAGPVRPVVSLELRRGKEPVNPLDFAAR
ncbi:septal ring factor EnvC (AmiA/AmiB activator) [Novosphingobium kunmingense]|uniref:Septal ring factor EnvC (AmiA/AmiB activator) n=1 Tax=Novosphingobium kunmingense TaxID=1211806 RepID=A0A2N0H559_9SPHN|nr:peptidoglycan DD-metalloendopeptidase family protein [Novosphingobium kunmingense]PKB14062.1 septal ring factor EnvC (AmiA/AmiB activator) [Novosphingobium kunmingense]